MNSVNQTTSPSAPRTLIGAVHLSRAIVEGLYAEMQKPDLPRRKLTPGVIGLLFGTLNSTSLQLEHFEPVHAGDVGPSILAGGERLHEALEERVLAIRSSPVQSPALVAWYVSGGDDDPGFLDRVIAIHNAIFKGDNDLAVTLKVDTKAHFAIEVYAAKAGAPLSKNNHRVGSWYSANWSALPEQVDVVLADRANNELFLSVYRAAKSPDEGEVRGNWERIQRYTARLIPTFGSTGRAGQDRLFGTGVTSATAPPFALTPEKRPSSLPQERPHLQTWLPPSLEAPSIPQKTNGSFLRTAAWLLATIIISVLTYIAAHLYLKPALLSLTGQASTGSGAAPVKAAAAQTLFGLKVSQNGTALELQWNPLYHPIQLATSGKLIINDGTSTRVIEMDQTQLRSGRIVYIPASGDVRFSLTVIDSPSHGITDSIRVLATPSEKISNGGRSDGEQKPLSRGVRGVPIAGHPGVDHPGSGVVQSDSHTNPNGTAASFHVVPENRPAGSPERPATPLIVQPVSSVPHFGTLPNLAASFSSPTEIVDNAKQKSQKEAAPGLSPQDLSRQQLPVANRPPVDLKITPALKSTPGLTDRKVPLATPPETTRQKTPVSSSLPPVQQRSFDPPVALHRQYPTLRHGVLFSNVVVPVIVHINEAGKILSVALESPNSKIRPDIAKEALAAARQWRFSPAKMGDKAVSSEMRINFVFRPSTATGIAP